MDPQKPDPHPHPHPHPLKCPRCDSSNTKFCYYNNYSLSQPRHFCKACKRYWTRGGTLRNVPVGGGCRKNKRASKRPPSSPPTQPTSAPSNINRIHNPLFYNNNANNPIELNFPFSSFRVSSDNNNNNPGFDLHPQMTGFSASGLDHHHNHSHAGLKAYQDVPAFSGHHNSILFGSSGLGSASTMASLLGMKGVQAGVMPYEDPGKDVKVEGENNRPVWNPIDQINNSSDPSSSLLWNNAWFDPSNMASSVPSLI